MKAKSFMERVTNIAHREGLFELVRSQHGTMDLSISEKSYFGLPMIEIELDGLEPHHRAAVIETLASAGLQVSYDDHIIKVAPCEVRVLVVPSSDQSKPGYNVRVEDNKVVFCGCKGYAYRLDCKHAVSVAAEIENHRQYDY